MATVDALFNGQGVVWQIIVDDKGAEFQVKSFRADIRGNEDFRLILEAFHDGILTGFAAVVGQNLALVRAVVQEGKQKILRGAVFGEDKSFLLCAKFLESGKTLFQACEQFCDLGVLFDAGGQSLHVLKFGKFSGNVLALCFSTGFHPPNHAAQQLVQSESGRGKGTEEHERQIILVHVRKRSLVLPLHICLKQIIQFLFFGCERKFNSNRNTFRNLDVVRYFRSGGTKTEPAYPVGQFRVVFRLAEITLVKRLFIREHGLVNKMNQAVQVHDGVLHRRGREQNLEGVADRVF